MSCSRAGRWVAQMMSLTACVVGCAKEAPLAAAPERAAHNEVLFTAAQLSTAQIEISEVRALEVTQPILASGRIAFEDERVSHVFSPVTGQVHTIFGQPGQKVQQGDPLLRLESPDIGQFTADLDKARADLVAAEREFKRRRDLFVGHAASASDFEVASRDYRRAQAEHDRAQEKIRLLHTDPNLVSQSFTLRAPIAGEIVRRAVSPGMEVQGQYEAAASPTELFTIGELSQVLALGELFEMDLPRIHVGDSLMVRDVAYPAESFAGHVTWIAGAIDPQTRTARVRCALPNPQGKLKPEMFVTMTIVPKPGAPKLAILRRAIYRLGGRTLVLVVGPAAEPGLLRISQRDVEVEEGAAGELVPVKRGLVAGERIISKGGILLTGLFTTPDGAETK